MGEGANEKPSSAPPASTSTPKPTSSSKTPPNADVSETPDIDIVEAFGGFFRGCAVLARKALIPLKKAVAAKAPVAKQTVRAIGENRPLAFASEGAVAGESLLPRLAYYGAWGLSGTAIAADIYIKQHDAPPHLRLNTALYWTAFHVPASLVIPAVIVHRIVHAVEHAVQNPKGMAKSWPPRAKAIAPVVAALLSIIPVVPIVDHAAEAIMEPTLGAYLGLVFEHHHGHESSGHSDPAKQKED
jgi:hypothetical protein